MTINHEALKKRRAGSRMGGFGWKAKENGNKVRILPPHSRFIGHLDQLEDLCITYKIHYFKVEGKQTEVSRCLDELKQKCPACEMYRAYKKSTDPALVEMAKSIRAADQYLFNILDVNNLQAGIQAWAANYTCWDKIMEIAANPAWGDVIDPANGVNFDVTMTPGSRSRTGHNQYSVMPEPQRTTVMAILEAQPDWQAKMDALDENITPEKTAEEISGWLEEMGFPPIGGGAPRGPGGGVPLPVVGTPAVVSAPAVPTIAPAQVPTIAPVPLPSVAPVPLSPAPVAPAAPTPVGVAVPVAAPAVPVPLAAPEARHLTLVGNERPTQAHPSAPTNTAGPHYDPGPAFVEVTPAAERPTNAPRCFGGYAPAVHRCQPCPVVVDCQMRMLGVS